MALLKSYSFRTPHTFPTETPHHTLNRYPKNCKWAYNCIGRAAGHSKVLHDLPSFEGNIPYLEESIVQPCRRSLVATLTGAAMMFPSLSMLAEPASALTVEQLLFLEAWRSVDRAYVDKTFNGQAWFKVRQEFLDKEKFSSRTATYAAIAKLLATLDDPFTRFLEPSRMSALKRGTSGSVTGIGVEVTLDDEQGAKSELVVLTPALGGPAARAGIVSGDVITAVDGNPTRGLSLYEASEMLLGEVDTQVTISVRSAASADSRDITLTREVRRVTPVSSMICTTSSPTLGLPPSTARSVPLGLLRIATFNSNTAPAVKEALEGFKAAGVAGIVLDLRNNGGGLFPAGVLVAKYLISTGDIVLIADSAGVRDIYSADRSAILPETPLSVLVNRGTASASEVLAGALHDNKRGTLVGERTFGKGLIQTLVELSDGSGIAVTAARYQTPAGVDINKAGITPDIMLPADKLPLDLDELCEALSASDAPSLFK